MKKTRVRTLIVATALVAAVSASSAAYAMGGFGRSAAEPATNRSSAAVPGDGTCLVPAVPVDATVADLTATEVVDLTFLLEEEKLARDVYAALYEQWSLRTFANIATSEQRHMDAVEGVLVAYGVDYAVSETPGVFENDELQALYDQLIARGSDSLASAIEVGILVERVDIADIDEQLINTENVTIEQVYENLRAGSEKHLAAFTKVYGIYADGDVDSVTL